MKDHFELISKQNVLRQAVMDLACNYNPSTLIDIVEFTLDKGYTPDRLAKFAIRVLGMDYESALKSIFYLCPNKLN